MKHKYFTKTERLLWGASTALIVIAFLIFDRSNFWTLISSCVGVTSLIFCAKGNPIGQALMILFSLLYGYISYTFSYYGEMITYLGMTAPMALFALICWLRHPFAGNRSQVAVGRLQRFEYVLLPVLTVAVTALFCFLLKAFGTANLLPSTLSVTTSFLAVYLTFRRDPRFALAYAANDVVLIVLWVLAALENTTYVCMIVCFVVFLVNDLYGYLNWKQMEKAQNR